MSDHLIYKDFWELRRHLQPDVVNYDESGTNEYEINFHKSSETYRTKAENIDGGVQDGTDFEDHKIQYCKKFLKAGHVHIQTHNFNMNMSWVNGTDNSYYCICPIDHKALKILSVEYMFGDDLTFAGSSKLMFNIWRSADDIISCPDHDLVNRTAFGPDTYVPTATPTGWKLSFPVETQDEIQKKEIWEYYLNDVHQYTVTSFTYENLMDLKMKSHLELIDGYAKCKFTFLSDILLSHEREERIELYINDDVAFTATKMSHLHFNAMSFVDW